MQKSPHLPRDFVRKTQGLFGLQGEDWLRVLPGILDEAVKQWHLSDLQLPDTLSINLIYFATSPIYGEVVLKVGFPHPELYTEMEALPCYKKGSICTCYQMDKNLGALLLERIRPGWHLGQKRKDRESINEALDFIPSFPVYMKKHPAALPTYKSWVDQAFQRALREKKMELDILLLLHEGGRIADQFQRLTPFLLHGDLHHFNLLRNQQGELTAIDPKGVLGAPFFRSSSLYPQPAPPGRPEGR